MLSPIGDPESGPAVVTGACGFLGRSLIPLLCQRGYTVFGLDLKPSPLKFAAYHHFTGPLSSSLEQLVKYLDNRQLKGPIVFHLAGLANAAECSREPDHAFQLNVCLTLQMLDFCRQHEITKFIFPSTGLVYGDSGNAPAFEGNPLIPDNVYVATKMAAEALIQAYAKQYTLACAIARLSNVYGRGLSSETVLGTILEQVRGDDQIFVKNLRPIRDFIHVQDVVSGLLRLAAILKEGGCLVVNLSTGKGHSIREAAEIVCEATRLSKDNIRSDSNAGINESYLVLNNRRLLDLTGWTPAYSLTEGLREILQDNEQAS